LLTVGDRGFPAQWIAEVEMTRTHHVRNLEAIQGWLATTLTLALTMGLVGCDPGAEERKALRRQVLELQGQIADQEREAADWRTAASRAISEAQARAQAEAKADQHDGDEIGDWIHASSGFDAQVADALNDYEIVTQIVHDNQTGAEACEAVGKACFAMTNTRVSDSKNRFCGYDMPSCTSRVRRAPRCMKSNGVWLNYMLDRVHYRRAKDADRNASCEDNGKLCMHSPSYQSAICIGHRETKLSSPRSPSLDDPV
jgi:hypothetical protein